MDSSDLKELGYPEYWDRRYSNQQVLYSPNPMALLTMTGMRSMKKGKELTYPRMSGFVPLTSFAPFLSVVC